MAIGTAAAIGLGISAVGTAYTIKQGQDAKKAQNKALDAAQVDINNLNTQTADRSRQNAQDSAELEKQLTPEVPELRRAANTALLGGIGKTDAGVEYGKGLIGSSLGAQAGSPLLQAAIAKAQADLGMGGNLDTDTQNAVTRKGLATAGTVGGGLGLGRDVVARDLGLTSLQLQQQRLAAAAGIGGQELGMNQWNASHLLDSVNLLSSIHNNDLRNNLATAQYAESIRRPIVGLDPGASANLQVANQNAQAQGIAAQANLKGQNTQNIITGVGNLYSAFNQYRAANAAQPYTGYTAPTNASIYAASA